MVGTAVPVDRSIRPYDMSCCPPVQTPEPSGPFPTFRSRVELHISLPP
jgi:hypothetical protein